MADEPQKVYVQSNRIDASIIPPGFSLPYRLYVIQQTTDIKNIADASNGAGQLAYQATIKNSEQDVVLDDHESRIASLRVEVNDHEIRITGNTQNIASLAIRMTSAEGDINTLKADYISKTAIAPQSISSPLNVTTSYSVDGKKVVGARSTGWTSSTGTASKAGINGSTTYSASATYTQSELQAIATGLQQVRQLVVALQNAMGATSGHGLIDA